MWSCIETSWNRFYQFILSYFQHKVISKYGLVVIQKNKLFQSANNDYRYHMRERFIYFPLEGCQMEGKCTFKITRLPNIRDTLDRIFIDFDKEKAKEMLYHNYRYQEYRKNTLRGGFFQIRIPLTRKFPPYLLYQFKD